MDSPFPLVAAVRLVRVTIQRATIRAPLTMLLVWPAAHQTSLVVIFMKVKRAARASCRTAPILAPVIMVLAIGYAAYRATIGRTHRALPVVFVFATPTRVLVYVFWQLQSHSKQTRRLQNAQVTFARIVLAHFSQRGRLIAKATADPLRAQTATTLRSFAVPPI